MNATEWGIKYPAKEVSIFPSDYIAYFNNYWEAENYRDWYETVNDVCCEVVKWRIFYYVIYKD